VNSGAFGDYRNIECEAGVTVLFGDALTFQRNHLIVLA
jgi:hypothetical protein